MSVEVIVLKGYLNSHMKQFVSSPIASRWFFGLSIVLMTSNEFDLHDFKSFYKIVSY